MAATEYDHPGPTRAERIAGYYRLASKLIAEAKEPSKSTHADLASIGTIQHFPSRPSLPSMSLEPAPNAYERAMMRTERERLQAHVGERFTRIIVVDRDEDE